MSLTNAYTCGPNCAPSQAALLSGQNGPRRGNCVYDVDNLNRGKRSGRIITSPLIGGNIGSVLDPYAKPYTSAESQQLAGSEVLTGTRKHVTDAITDAAIGFMEQFVGRDKGRPERYNPTEKEYENESIRSSSHCRVVLFNFGHLRMVGA